MKILNLYACLGGNRYKWDEVTDIEVTAVELDPELARLYKERFPNDKVIVADAHQYLLDHYKEFDFIWSSPPCPTHSSFQHSMKNKRKMNYPDMKLYQEIIFLDNFFYGKYCVENVIPFYKPLIQAKKRHRHLYWTNFNLPNVLTDRNPPNITRIDNELKSWIKFYNYDISKYKGKKDKRRLFRNMVDYEAGRTILETAVGIVRKQNVNQTTIFDEC
jgi:DNA (cytosine-5)-methyltransferase 1